MANGGGGGGGCYTTIRELPEDHDIEITECKISVKLTADLTARFDFDYFVQGTPTCKPHHSFWFIVPNPLGALNGFQATDTSGNLESTPQDIGAGASRKTKFTIRYREEMRSGRTQHLHFSFQNAASLIVSRQRTRKLIVYTDYVSHTVDCKYVSYELVPPPGYGVLESPFSAFSPLVRVSSANSPQPLKAEFRQVEARSPVPIQVTFISGRRLGKQFWGSAFLLLLAAEVSAIFGVVSASADWRLAVIPVIPLAAAGLAALSIRD
jgi:hypothetical protein